MDDPDELELVRTAIISHITGDCEWDDRAARRVRSDPDLQGLTPESIKELLQDYVGKQGSQVIEQVQEKRDPDRRFDRFYYKVILPVDEFKHGLFVEIILTDDDPKAPAVQMVNAHEQRR